MHRPLLSALMTLAAAAPLAAQERWETFHNTLTDRHGAYVCSVFDEGTGDFFCLELACEAGGALAMELSRDGTTLSEDVQASFAVNGVVLNSFPFAPAAQGGFAIYRSEAAAADAGLRYWLEQGNTAQVTVGEEVQALSLAGSSTALRDVYEACS